MRALADFFSRMVFYLLQKPENWGEFNSSFVAEGSVSLMKCTEGKVGGVIVFSGRRYCMDAVGLYNNSAQAGESLRGI